MELFCYAVNSLQQKDGRALFKYFNITFAVSMSRIVNAVKSSPAYGLIYLHAENGTKTKYRKLKNPNSTK